MDVDKKDCFGYALSKDGIHWTNAMFVELKPKCKKWWTEIRTPLGLIPEGDNTFAVFFTAMMPIDEKQHGVRAGNIVSWVDYYPYGTVGMVRLKLKSDDAVTKALSDDTTNCEKKNPQ